MIRCHIMLLALIFLTNLLVDSNASVNVLEFIPQPTAVDDAVIYLTESSPSMLIDATVLRRRTVYFTGRHLLLNKILTFSCNVNQPVSSLSQIVISARLPNAGSPSSSVAIPLNSQRGQKKLHQTEFTYRVTPNGVLLDIAKRSAGDRSSSSDTSLIFSCSVTNNEGVGITSGEVEIRDAIYYASLLPISFTTDVTILPALDPADFPYRFDCFHDLTFTESSWPSWMHTLSGAYSPYAWGSCRVTSNGINPVDCMLQGGGDLSAASISYFNGTMYILDPKTIGRQNIAIYCGSFWQKSSIRTFASKIIPSTIPSIDLGLTLSADVSPSHSSKRQLRALSPLEQSFELLDGSALNGFALDALYLSPSCGVTYSWRKDGESLSGSQASRYSLKLSKKAIPILDGTYTLSVVSKCDSTPQSLKFVRTVTIVESPVFRDPRCLAGLFYVMSGTDYHTKCQFILRPGTTKYKALVGINGDTIKADTPKSLKQKLHAFDSADLKELDIDFSVADAPSSSSSSSSSMHDFEVSAKHLSRTQNFQLSIHLESLLGDAHLSLAIRTIPIPSLQAAPSASNCDGAHCDKQPSELSCGIQPALLQQWRDDFGISSSVDWVIQDRWSSDDLEADGIGQFFELGSSGDTSTLKIWPEGKPSPDSDTDAKVPEPSAADASSDTTDQPQPATNQSTTSSSPSSSVSPTLRVFLATHLGAQPATLFVKCWIRLRVVEPTSARFVPASPISSSSRRRRQTTLQDPSVIFDSRWTNDAELRTLLTAVRAFPPTDNTATASIIWIVAVVIGCLIIIIVICLLVWLYKRNREKYFVHKEEIKRGYNPVEELRQSNTFQPYSGGDDAPTGGVPYYHTVTDGNLRVDSESDGELDAYDADFNEDASFINGYSHDPTVQPRQHPSVHAPLISSSHLGSRQATPHANLSNAGSVNRVSNIQTPV